MYGNCNPESSGTAIHMLRGSYVFGWPEGGGGKVGAAWGGPDRAPRVGEVPCKGEPNL